VTGTIWKDVKKKISYLKKLESPQINDLYPENEEKFAGEHDDIYIEDETGRRKILLGQGLTFQDSTISTTVNKNTLVTGAIVALRCCLSEDNLVFVTDIILPGLIRQSKDQCDICPIDPVFSRSNPPTYNKQKMSVQDRMNLENLSSNKKNIPENLGKEKGDLDELLKRIKNGYSPKLVAFISGIDITNVENCRNFDNFELFVDWLIGMSSCPELAKHVGSLVIGGNLVKINENINLGLVSAYRHESDFSKMLTDLATAIKKIDTSLSKVAKHGINVNVMPGKNDTADSFYPQRAFAKL